MDGLLKKSPGDIAHSVAKGIISAIPYAGGPLAVLFEEVFQKPLDKRRAAWLNTLADAIKELQEKVGDISLDNLASNDMFITATIQASQVAQKTHQQEKLEALRNAVQNSVLPSAPEEDLQLLFLRYIDELTPWHLRVLSLLDSPEKWLNANGKPLPGWGSGGVSNLIEYAFPDLKGKRAFYGLLVADLQARGMLEHGSILNSTMTGIGIIQSRTTPMGKQFLNFISKPFQ
jgi:hypothetical protein